jgi:hypothetical protein
MLPTKEQFAQNEKDGLQTFEVEVTDTFGGEANYSWVHRETFHCDGTKSDTHIVRAAKKAAGYTGVKCKRTLVGEMIQLDVVGQCVRIFISPENDFGV